MKVVCISLGFQPRQEWSLGFKGLLNVYHDKVVMSTLWIRDSDIPGVSYVPKAATQVAPMSVPFGEIRP
jgi:hypothetical protein